MSKLNFRSRQVDYSKPLPIYLNNDLPDLQDLVAINRSVPQMPTGMEKEEEAEHHLQRALSALQVYGTTTSNEYAIPTPNVEIDIQMYERIYSVECPKQKQYIRIQPFSNDFDYPDYDADVEDEEWLNEYRKKLPDDFSDDLFLFFENIMDRLEKAVGFSTNLMSRDEAKFLLLEKEEQTDDNLITTTTTTSNENTQKANKYKTEKDEFILCIYEYWKLKRLKCNHPLTPTVLTDKCGVVTAPNNPYLVFRRRTEKMQTRKNRKTEEQSYEKMLILKRDLIRAQQILKFIKQRENLKKELLKLTLETFEKRLKLNDYDGTVVESIRSGFLKTKCPTMGSQPVLVNAKHNAAIDKKLNSLIQNKSPSLKRDYSDSNPKLIQTVNTKKLKKDISNKNKLSPVNVNIQQTTSIVTNNINNNNKSIVNSLNNQRTLLNTTNLLKDKHKRLIRQQLGVTPTKPESMDFNGDSNLKTPSPTSHRTTIEPIVSNEDTEYIEELRQNNIENLDSVLDETKNKFCTSVEIDGYWSFKRKEGCKYLAQNGSIFKNDAFDYFNSLEPEETVSNTQQLKVSPTKQNRKLKNLRNIQHKVYGYLVNKNRHLGLVRRRVGRGGRILLDKLNPESIDMLSNNNNTETHTRTDQDDILSSSSNTKFQSFENLCSFKTFYPVDSQNSYFNESIAVVPAIESSPEAESEDDNEHLDRVYYDYKMFNKMNLDLPFPAQIITNDPTSNNSSMNENDDAEDKIEPVKSTLNFFDFEPAFGIENFDMNEMFDTETDSGKYFSSDSYVKVDFRPSLNDDYFDTQDTIRKIKAQMSLKNFISVKKEDKTEVVKSEPKVDEQHPRLSEQDKSIKIESKLLNGFNLKKTLLLNNPDALTSSNSTISNLINKLNNELNSEPAFLTSSILPIINGNKYSTTSTSSLPSSSASSSSSSSSSSSPLSNTTTATTTQQTTSTKTQSSTNGTTNGPYLFTSSQSGLTLNGIASKSNKFEIF